MNIIFLSQTESTQKFGINMIQNGEINEETLIYTEKQTHGVGRDEKKWDMGFGNIAMSLIFEIKDLSIPYSILSGYILVDFLKKYSVDILIKWPNDLYLNGKKIGGIITNIEKFNDKIYCIIGIGVNLVSNPKITEYESGNILDEVGVFIDQKKSIISLAEKIFSTNFEKSKSGIIKSLNNNLYGIGKKCQCGDVFGVFSGVDELGFAIIKNDLFEEKKIGVSTLRFLN